MTQNTVNYANNPTGPELLDDYLAKEQQNNLTSNSGVQRPSYVQAGTKWLDTSSTPWVWKMFDGTSDVTLGTVNPTTHIFTAAGLDTAVLLTGDQTVSGVKTFSNNPLVPNVTAGDSSSKVANTAFVAAGLATVVSLTGDQTVAGVKTFSSNPLVPTPSVSDNSQKPATTAYIETKFQVVNALPQNPDSNTFYFIEES